MSVKFGGPIDPGTSRGTSAARQNDDHAARDRSPDPVGSLRSGDGPPLPRRNAGLAGMHGHRTQAGASAVLRPETVAAEICGQAISGRLPIAGCYSSKALASAAGIASNGVAALLGRT